jgi:hypothetical protein
MKKFFLGAVVCAVLVSCDWSVFFPPEEEKSVFSPRQEEEPLAVTAAAVPAFTPEGGTFSDRVTVSIASGEPGAAIRYTLDGSGVTEESPLYTGPFDLARSAAVRARAYIDGHAPSGEAAARFTIPTYIVAEVQGMVKRTTTVTNNTEVNEFLAREVPYLYDEDNTVYYYTYDGPSVNINDVFFKATSDSSPLSPYHYQSNSFPHNDTNNTSKPFLPSRFSLPQLDNFFISTFAIPYTDQRKLLFSSFGYDNINLCYPTELRNEVYYDTHVITELIRSDSFELPYNTSYTIPPNRIYDQDIPVTLYTDISTVEATTLIATIYKTMHYYETLDVHTEEMFQSLNRVVYKSVTVYLDAALSVDSIEASGMVDTYSQAENAITFTIKEYSNPIRFEIARITAVNKITNERQMKILQLK